MIVLFPALVFRSPGPNRHSSGGTYRFAQVQDAEELEAMLAQGYHADVRAAIVECGERAFTHGLTATQARMVPVAKLLARLRARLAEDAVPAQVVEVQEPEVLEVLEPPADDAPPTREEMLEQAARVGLKVDRRWSDARLLAKIDEAMAKAAKATGPESPAVVTNDHGNEDNDPI